MSVLREDRDGFVVLTLHDDANRNALGQTMVADLRGHVASCAAEGRTLVVFRHKGPAFSSGFDRSGDPADDAVRQRFVEIQRLLDELLAAPFMTVAYATGPAVGAGADLFMHCDIRYAGRGASFLFPGVRFGIVLGIRRLVNVVGTEAALELVLRQRRFDATEAAAAGLARLMPDDDHPGEELASLAASVGSLGQPTVGHVLRVIRMLDEPKGGGSAMDHLTASLEPPGLVERMAGGLGRLGGSDRLRAESLTEDLVRSSHWQQPEGEVR